MIAFTDNVGRSWTVAIDIATVKRVRSVCGVDLLSAVGGDLIERLMRDPVLLVDTLYAVCKPEADRLGVSDEDFGRGMAGDAIDSGTKALIQELVSFTPNPRDRANLARVIETMWKAMDQARDRIETRIGTELESRVRTALEDAGI